MLKMMRLIALAALACMLIAAEGVAKTYVSLNGNFYINYPEEWEQIDFVTVDAFLQRGSADESLYNYDAVLAPSSSSPFFATEYLIVTLEMVGQLSDSQVDSVLREFQGDYSRSIVSQPFDTMLTRITTSRPSFDSVLMTLSILSDIYQSQNELKKNLTVMKFYDKGIATFYFYSPDTMFDSSKKTFSDIVHSFGTENVKAALPKEAVKVADIKTDEQGNLRESGSKMTLYLSIGVLALLIIFIVVRMKQKSS